MPAALPVSTPVAGGTLTGTLLLPSGTGPFPSVLLVAGSGPTDRDGNQPGARNDALRLVAEALTARGVATVRYDKRGVAAGAALVRSEADLRFDDYVADAAAWIRQLASDPRLRRPVLVGHSEGALVATLAAQQAPVAGVLTLAGAGRPLDDVLLEQLAATLPSPAVEAARQVLTDLQAGRQIAVRPPAIPADLWEALFRPSVQPYLTSLMRHDPATALGRVAAAGIPTRVVQGTTDLQVTVRDAARLAATVGQRPVLVDGMNHVLRLAPADRAANLATYTNPTLPLAPGLADTMAAFVRVPR